MAEKKSPPSIEQQEKASHSAKLKSRADREAQMRKEKGLPKSSKPDPDTSKVKAKRKVEGKNDGARGAAAPSPSKKAKKD